MTDSVADIAEGLQDLMESLERGIRGFRGLRVDRDGDRLCIVFRWFDDPNVYQIWSAAHGGLAPWDEEVDELGLEEELQTGLLLRASKTRYGDVLRIDLDAPPAYESGADTFYLSELLDYVGHLSGAGLDTGPGLSARRTRTLVGWIGAYANNGAGAPALGHIVTVRETADTAQITQLETTPDAKPIVGLELVFSAVHRCARHGIHRLYGSRSIAALEVFGFAATTDRPSMVVYDITRETLNWPGGLPRRPHD